MLRWIALLPVLLVPLAVWGVVHFGAVARDTSGPTAIATSEDGRVLLAVNATLFALDGNGRVTARWPTREAGLDPWISDLLLLPDGDLLVAGGIDGRLMRCSTGATLQCRSPFASAEHPGTRWHVPMKLAWHDGRVLVSLGNANRVNAFDPDTGTVTPVVASGLLHPNNLFLRDGDLYVSDTDHGRIARCTAQDVHACEPSDWATGFGIAGTDMTRPTQITDDGYGGAWALVVNGRMSNGTLVRLDSRGAETTIVDVPDRTHLASLARLNTDLLVIDSEAFRVWRVDANARAREFGDTAFRAELAAWREQRDNAANYGFMSLLGIFGLLLAAAVLLAVASAIEARREGAATTSRPLNADASGTHWLPAAVDRRGNAGGRILLLFMLLVIPLPVMLAVLPMISAGTPSAAGMVAGLVLGTVIAVAGGLAWSARRKRMDGAPLGLREQHLVVRLGKTL